MFVAQACCNAEVEQTYTDVLRQRDDPLVAFHTWGGRLLTWRQPLLRRRTVQSMWLHLLLS